MTVNIWKSYRRTADEEVNMKAIFAVMNTTTAVVKIWLEKIQACTGSEQYSNWKSESVNVMPFIVIIFCDNTYLL